MTVDLSPATSAMQTLVAGVTDEQLTLTTPCEKTTVGGLLAHIDGFCLAFTAAARKTPLPGAQGQIDPSMLGDDWRTRLPGRLDELSQAWREPDAWAGATEAGGQPLPGETAGLIALDEVLVHSWDIAVATGQAFEADPVLIEAALGFVRPVAEANPGGTPGLFGPAVPVPGEAPAIDRLIGLTGRDPRWCPASAA